MNSNERTLLSNQSDQAPDVPYSDELNPLMNPLLSENMGRWADVYFNHPPEQREQAVLSLVHELQAEKSHREKEKTSGPESTSEEKRESKTESASGRPSAATSDSDLVRCAGCGHENPRWHKFCGMCGAGVTHEESNSALASVPESIGERENEGYTSGSDTQEPDAAGDSRGEPEPFENSITNPHELSLFRSFREADSSSYDDSEPQSHVRLYVGIVLVLVILGLAYMGWKNGLFTTQSSQEALPPTSNTTKPAPPETASTKTSAPETAAPAKKETAPAANKAEAPLPAPVKPKTTVAEKAPAKTSAAPKPAPSIEAAAGPDPRIEMIREHLDRYRSLSAQGKWAEAGKELEAVEGLVKR